MSVAFREYQTGAFTRAVLIVRTRKLEIEW